MFCFRQNHPQRPPLDLGAAVASEFDKIRHRIVPGARIAVAVGSRGITNLASIVDEVLQQIRAAEGQPCIIPAMGSHGGATPEGQRGVLATYGVTEAAMGAPILASLEVREIGISRDGAPVYCGAEALGADGIVLINRVKPHTDFKGAIGSGLLKMCAVGLGKQMGATALHAAASRIGFERAIRGIAGRILEAAPILGGVAILEGRMHETCRIVVLPREDMEAGEEALLDEALGLMPKLPFDEIDLLIVDRMGKNISGSGMDPNVIGREGAGYSASLIRGCRPAPFVKRLFIRDLTPETHGNAVGLGLADFTTTRLVRAIDPRSTYVNALTALAPQSAKIPIHFDTDREIVEEAIASLAMPSGEAPRVVRIADTLSLTMLEASEALWLEASQRGDLTLESGLREMGFEEDGNLLPLRASSHGVRARPSL